MNFRGLMEAPPEGRRTFTYDQDLLHGHAYTKQTADVHFTRGMACIGVSTEYQHDVASRLTTLIYRNAAGVLGNLTYQYDPAGNRTQVGGSYYRARFYSPQLHRFLSEDPIGLLGGSPNLCCARQLMSGLMR